MVWGCFVNNKLGPLVVIEGTLNGAGYRELLANHLKPFLDELGPDLYISKMTMRQFIHLKLYFGGKRKIWLVRFRGLLRAPISTQSNMFGII